LFFKESCYSYEGFLRQKGYELAWPSSVFAVNNIMYTGLKGDDSGFRENPKPAEVRSPLMTQGLRFLHYSLILRLAILKREDSKPSGIGDEKPISGPLCAESDVVFDDLQNSTTGTKT
jgi:hypothetical protein